MSKKGKHGYVRTMQATENGDGGLVTKRPSLPSPYDIQEVEGSQSVGYAAR